MCSDSSERGAAAAPKPPEVVGGHLVARRLKAHGVTKLFTLSGGHLFSIYDGCRAHGIDIVDTRHEQSAAFAAEGWAKVTRTPGVVALTAGPGVTNGMSAFASPLTKFAATSASTGEIPALLDAALAAALAPHGGAAFVDLPLDHVFGE